MPLPHPPAFLCSNWFTSTVTGQRDRSHNAEIAFQKTITQRDILLGIASIFTSNLQPPLYLMPLPAAENITAVTSLSVTE